MKTNRIIALFAGLSLALVSTAALASPSADTLLVAGYDHDQMSVLYGVSSIDQEDDTTASLDCRLVGTFEYKAGDATDGLAEVDSLSSVDQDTDDETPDDTTFEPETVVADPDNDPALADVEYGDVGAEECALTSVTIEPNGADKVTHGTIVSTFAHLLEGGHGCLIRLFAQSDFGKGDYDEVNSDIFEVTLDSFETACSKNKDKKEKDDHSSSVGDDDDSSGGVGKANAPGQNKDKKEKDDKRNNKAAKSDD